MKKYYGKVVDAKGGIVKIFDVPQKELNEIQNLIDQGKVEGSLDSIVVDAVEKFLKKHN